MPRALLRFPVSPRYAKMLAVAKESGDCLQHIVALCAAMTVGNMFLVEADVSAEDAVRDEEASDEEDDPEEDLQAKEERVWHEYLVT